MSTRDKTPTLHNLAVFCADIGSIKKGNFGWAASLPGDPDIIEGKDIKKFAEYISNQIRAGSKVAIGFECPLYVPMRNDPQEVNSARSGEGNRSWSAGAGTGALATGLAEVLWVLNDVKERLGRCSQIVVEWNEFLASDAVFMWEAFVTSSAKGLDHSHDAKIAVTQFRESLPDPWTRNAIHEQSVLSLLGAAALRSGWSTSIDILSKPCLVIKAV